MRIRTWLKNVFIPHAGNDYAPHSLQRAALVGMFGLVLISFAVTNLQSLWWISSEWMVSTILPAVIINDTNQQRIDGKLSGLTENTLLDAAANLKARDMAAHQYFAHFSPTGISPWYWFSQVGYRYQAAGENLAINFTDSSAIVTAWMNSPEHRANIMSNKYSQIGVGTAEGVYQGYKTVYVVQLFATPLITPVVSTASVPQPASRALVPVVATRTATAVVATTSVRSPAASVLAATTATPLQASATKPTVVAITAAPQLATTATSAQAVAALAASNGVLFSDLATTSAAPATMTAGATAIEPHPVPFGARALTQPQLVLEILYGLIALFVLVSLILSVVIEVRRQQPLQIAYSLGLLLVMAGLFSLHLALVSGVTIV